MSFDEVELGYSEEQARAEASRCVDCSVCCECRLCEDACAAKAIRHQQREVIREIPVSAVVLAPGYDTGDIPPELGYTRYKDVVTSLEYERILSASGPFSGHVQRPSDGRAPKRIAFLQCVGSRDAQCGADYCSAVCCMYAVKEAQITKEHLPSVEKIDIFYMDMRAYGKDFDRYVQSAKTKYGIGFIRSRVGGVAQNGEGALLVRYCSEDGAPQAGEYDLVVLSVGMKPGEQNKALYDALGVRTDRYGFVCTDDFSPTATDCPGIFACGAAAGPKDIPETVAEASAAAAGAARLAGQRETDLYRDYAAFFMEEPEVPMRDVAKEPIRTGVFVCHCGVNIGGYLTVRDVVTYAKTLPHVAFADESLYTCSVDAQKVILDRIKEYNLNRVVVASCTPRTHEPLFQGVLKKAGLNPYLFTMANIRDQCSWVHMQDRAAATAKAQQLVAMAVGKAAGARQLARKKIGVTQAALVIGGGIAGLSSARALADMGYPVHLVEQSPRLGGHALSLGADIYGRPVGPYMQGLVDSVLADGNITTYLSTEVETVSGYVGNFTTTLLAPDGQICVSHGAVVVAVGAGEAKPEGYLLGEENVVTHLSLEERLREPGALTGVQNVVMIQCAGQRDEARPYCSRLCCNQAVRNAIRIKELDPAVNVTVLYQELRAYGGWETAYQRARSLGVQFVRYADGEPPLVERASAGYVVTSRDPLLDIQIRYPVDIVSLAAAVAPDRAGNAKLAQMLKVPQNADGFFMEAHAKLRPVDFATEGVYVAGLAHSPKNLRESAAQGRAAAARAATVLAKPQLETEGTIASVNTSLCAGCGACEAVCAYGAISVQEVVIRRQKVRKAVVNDVLCKGCGTCSATCRCGAVDVGGFSDAQVLNELGALLRGRPTGENA